MFGTNDRTKEKKEKKERSEQQEPSNNLCPRSLQLLISL